MLFKEELFVPILCVAKYKHFDEALQLCNESEYGLTSGIYRTKKEEIHSFLENAKAGVIYVNRAPVPQQEQWWVLSRLVVGKILARRAKEQEGLITCLNFSESRARLLLPD